MVSNMKADSPPIVNGSMKAMWIRLGYKDVVATAIETELGYSNLAEVSEMVGQDNAAYNFVKNIHKWKDGANAYKVTLRAEENTKKLLFFLQHMERTSRIISPADCTMTKIKALDL